MSRPTGSVGAAKCLSSPVLAITAFLALLLCDPSKGLAVPMLGADLATFAVLGAAGVTTDPASTIGGNLGSAPTASLTGTYNFTSGSLQPNTTLAQNAQTQLDAAIIAVNGAAGPVTALTNLTGLTLAPGIYTISAAATNLTGALVLDGGGDPNAVWIFRATTTLITNNGSTVTVEDVGTGAGVGVYWTVGSAATLNGNTFAGNVLSDAAITSDGGLTIACGRLLSATASVTLVGDTISTGCEGVGAGSNGFDQASAVAVVPEPATLLLLGLGLAGLSTFRKRFSRA